MDKHSTTWKERIRMALVSCALIWVARLVGITLRTRSMPVPDTHHLRRGSSGAIFALWHGDHFPTMWTFRHRETCVITSQSRDGELLTRILEGWGIRAVRGSSSRGGIGALKEMARIVRSGRDGVVAVDGPRGPRHVVKPGIVLLAKLTGAPIIPVVASASRYWQFKSWDRYRLPKPFARTLVLFGEPLFVPAQVSNDQLEVYRAQLEQSLLAMQPVVEDAVRSNRGVEMEMIAHTQRMGDARVPFRDHPVDDR